MKTGGRPELKMQYSCAEVLQGRDASRISPRISLRQPNPLRFYRARVPEVTHARTRMYKIIALYTHRKKNARGRIQDGRGKAEYVQYNIMYRPSARTTLIYELNRGKSPSFIR